MSILALSTTTYLLIATSLMALILVFIDYLKSRKSVSIKIVDTEASTLPDPPGPKPWPIIGSLHILGRYDVPYKAFAELARIYNSQIIKLKMGSVQCVVVNGLENIKEVLITKGPHFDSRPNFARYHLLFCGDKENSLAFCDWSEVQKSRRETLRAHTFPRAFTAKYDQLNSIIGQELEVLIDQLGSKPASKFAAKPLILETCANIFTNYFCSRRFDIGNTEFSDMVKNFDKVFYEVNQGYAADFMPFLMPLHNRNMARMANWSEEIRQFVEKNIIEDRLESWTDILPEDDYVNCLINHVASNAEPNISWGTALFALEDIIGGHAAVGNLLMKVLGYLVVNPQVQKRSQEEIDAAEKSENRRVGLEQRGSMPYTESIVLEAIRLISSPIVPHVANQDSSVAGYRVEKGSLIFLNNYELNMTSSLWTDPTEFKPERFLVNGRISKPEHFLPFGGGRRSCMGYKMVQYLSFSTLATILKNFTILPVDGESYKIPLGNLALPENTFSFRFQKR
ncbi:cytochrome P450 307a1-like [Athalia rosae]|uniref:cytochrome P450 307a1-like n=1 Tax=Athalia rosae TaxID=37344 RepID=UPI0020345EB6|nr:cytochrome P450 307a1-like [Athalia rosae]XP_048513765.1 cytochrome P450 307a1-like [Athalia rosae]